MSQQQHQTTTTLAIVGTDTLVEGILARLLREEGYATRLLEAYRTGLMDELLDGVDVLILAPGLKDGVRGAFLEAVSSTPKTAAIPVLSPSPVLKQALLDELGASASWRSLFEDLVGQIGAVLRRVKVLPVDGGEESLWETPRSEAV